MLDVPSFIADDAGRAIGVGNADAALLVVVLRGRMMEAADLAAFAHSLRVDAYFVFPDAPLRAQPRGYTWWPCATRPSPSPASPSAGLSSTEAMKYRWWSGVPHASFFVQRLAPYSTHPLNSLHGTRE